jgi:hypothetical protein
MKGNPMQKAREALALAPKCGAHCRTTGESCKNAAMANGRCRMHGGKSTGRPVIHGRYGKDAIQERQRVLAILRDLKELIGRIREDL